MRGCTPPPLGGDMEYSSPTRLSVEFSLTAPQPSLLDARGGNCSKLRACFIISQFTLCQLNRTHSTLIRIFGIWGPWLSIVLLSTFRASGKSTHNSPILTSCYIPVDGYLLKLSRQNGISYLQVIELFSSFVLIGTSSIPALNTC